MFYKFKTPDHPEANGQKAKDGDIAFRVWFPTDEGGKVEIYMGEKGFANLLEAIKQYEKHKINEK
jgi:hypothetical protein